MAKIFFRCSIIAHKEFRTAKQRNELEEILKVVKIIRYDQLKIWRIEAKKRKD